MATTTPERPTQLASTNAPARPAPTSIPLPIPLPDILYVWSDEDEDWVGWRFENSDAETPGEPATRRLHFVAPNSTAQPTAPVKKQVRHSMTTRNKAAHAGLGLRSRCVFKK